ncbi:hypothetical protein BKA67DRAFT_145273, partial [Truncatella angustata]
WPSIVIHIATLSFKESLLTCYQYHNRLLVGHFGLRPPNIDGKPVLNVDSLRVILIFNVAYDTNIFPLELHGLNLSGCYMILCYTGARPAELVNNERKKPTDGFLESFMVRKRSCQLGAPVSRLKRTMTLWRKIPVNSASFFCERRSGVIVQRRSAMRTSS